MVSFTIIGQDSQEELLEDFEEDHELGQVREYWEEYFDHIGWSKTATGEAISINKGNPMAWDDVKDQTLGELGISDGSEVRLVEGHVVG